MENIKAVITADIVNSSLLSKGGLKKLIDSLEELFHSSEILYGFYRGDSFYALCNVQQALKISCIIRTIAIQCSEKEGSKANDIRMAIGVGMVEEPIINLATAMGEAFVLSGREMDAMGKEGPRLAIRCSNVTADIGLAAIARFTDFILKKMTIKQAQVVHFLLQGATQVEAARKLGKSQPTINKHASAAYWDDLELLLKLYNKLAEQLV